MFNRVLWTLDNDFDPFLFERLCTDLMFRNGYKNIIPFGRTRDRGRDAQVSLYRGSHPHNSDRVFFQYSLEKRWNSKLKNEINKIKSYNQEISSLVFVTSQNVSGHKRDKLEDDFFLEHQCKLTIFDREWLRLQLEEANQDLAQKYLGIPGNLLLADVREVAKPSPPKKHFEEAWSLFVVGDYEQALPKLKDLVGKGFDADIWTCIAWCHYILLNYIEALRAIEKSLVLDPESRESLAIKGCILAESGISENSRTKLVLSKKIFLNLVEQEKSWVIYYNLGNVLGGLQEYVDAKESYLKAIDINSEIAEVWSNLGNCLHHLQEHEHELTCFDRAISLNPSLSQAFISKANTFGKVYGKHEEAINILDFVLEREPDVEREFPYFWYWRAKFLLEINDIHLALESVEIGLINFPDEQSLLELKSFILSNLWQTESTYLERAIEFFEMRAYSNLGDYRPFVQLAQIHLTRSKSEDALECIKNAVNILSPMQAIDCDNLNLLELPIEDLIEAIYHISIYERFRSTSPVSIPYLFENLDKILASIYQFSWICFLVSFNNLFHFFLKEVEGKPEKGDEIEVASSLLEAFKKCHINASRDIIKIASAIGVLYSNQPQNFKIQVMTSLMLALPEVALVESSRQIGYLVGVYNISPKVLEKVQLLVESLLNDWVKDLAIEVGRVVNTHFSLLNDSTESN